MADEDRERIQLSPAQVAASSLAAVSAAVLCSFFGVAGTVIGTAVTSVVATVGGALYAHSLRRTKARLRRMHKAGALSPPLTEVVTTARQQGQRLWRQLPVRLMAMGALAAFVIAIATVTAIELGLGKSLAAAFGVSHSGAHGTTVGSIVSEKHHHSSPTPSPSVTPTSPSPRPTTSHTLAPTPTPTVTQTVTATPTESAPRSTPPSGLLPSVTTSSKSR